MQKQEKKRQEEKKIVLKFKHIRWRSVVKQIIDTTTFPEIKYPTGNVSF